MNLVPVQMTDHDRAHWLADKVPQYNDYTAEAMAMLRRLADENAKMSDALTYCVQALQPLDDVKPRDWKTDRELLRIAHKIAVVAIRGNKK